MAAFLISLAVNAQFSIREQFEAVRIDQSSTGLTNASHTPIFVIVLIIKWLGNKPDIATVTAWQVPDRGGE